MKLDYAGKFGGRSDYQHPALPWSMVNCGGRFIIAFGTGTESDFDLSYRVSKGITEAAATFLCEAKVIDPKTFKDTFTHSWKTMSQQFPFDHENWHIAACTLLCAVIEDNQILIAWRGSQEAFLIRQNRIVNRTNGHFNGRMHPDIVANMTGTPEEIKQKQFLLRIPMKILHVEYEETTPDLLAAPWEIQIGDYLVLTSVWSLKADFSVDHLPACVTGKAPEEAAQTMVENAAESTGWSVSVVIRAVED